MVRDLIESFRAPKMKGLSVAYLMTLLESVMGSVVMVNHAQSRLVEISALNPTCKIHTSPPDIERMLEIMNPHYVHQMDDNSLYERMNGCQDLNGPAYTFIYPGTKWCGPGDIADHEDDLGKYKEEDRCCRDHDLCPDHLLSGKCTDGVCNKSPFTRSNCKCDEDFKRCLKKINSPTANTLGTIFFNVAQVMCFKRNCTDKQSCQLTFTAVSKYPTNITKKEITVNVLSNIFQDFIKNLFKHKTLHRGTEEVM